MSSGREKLVRELVAGREAVVQACWAQQAWGAGKLYATDGQPLRVVFPGWLNRGAGPDFREARVLIGATEHRGDVEIHLHEQDWLRHAHDEDPNYGRVVLHVVLIAGESPAARSASGAPIPVFVAGPHILPDALRLMDDPEQLLRRYESLPGRCGLRAAQSDPEAVEAVIAHAAEARARQKAERLDAEWQPGREEQLLFELIFQALGYRPYAPVFRSLARRYPLNALYPALALPDAEARVAILARWFGALGLLEEAPGTAEPESEGELAALAATWKALGEKPSVAALPRGGARPQNSPERRMVGAYHHLRFVGGNLLKGWLVFLKDLDALRDQPEFRRRAHDALNAAFATPAGEPWRALVSHGVALGGAPGASRKRPAAGEARLIGEDRVAVILANAVVPFFLTYARRRGDAELEKVLYRLFLVLPGEGPNWRTRFMTQRLMPLRPLPRTLRTQQGLIQIHQDFCTSFESGCGDCKFPDLIAPPER
ncbi:MAG: DUF2851 family protein [SAR324 cluster bacterium]